MIPSIIIIIPSAGSCVGRAFPKVRPPSLLLSLESGFSRSGWFRLPSPSSMSGVLCQVNPPPPCCHRPQEHGPPHALQRTQGYGDRGWGGWGGGGCGGGGQQQGQHNQADAGHSVKSPGWHLWFTHVLMYIEGKSWLDCESAGERPECFQLQRHPLSHLGWLCHHRHRYRCHVFSASQVLPSRTGFIKLRKYNNFIPDLEESDCLIFSVKDQFSWCREWTGNNQIFISFFLLFQSRIIFLVWGVNRK